MSEAIFGGNNPTIYRPVCVLGMNFRKVCDKFRFAEVGNPNHKLTPNP